MEMAAVSLYFSWTKTPKSAILLFCLTVFCIHNLPNLSALSPKAMCSY